LTTTLDVGARVLLDPVLTEFQHSVRSRQPLHYEAPLSQRLLLGSSEKLVCVSDGEGVGAF
jgi:hypothetical protein